MIGYRFLAPAEEEMTAASVFYDAASNGLGSDFLDDVQHASIGCVNILWQERRSLLV